MVISLGPEVARAINTRLSSYCSWCVKSSVPLARSLTNASTGSERHTGEGQGRGNTWREVLLGVFVITFPQLCSRVLKDTKWTSHAKINTRSHPLTGQTWVHWVTGRQRHTCPGGSCGGAEPGCLGAVISRTRRRGTRVPVARCLKTAATRVSRASRAPTNSPPHTAADCSAPPSGAPTSRPLLISPSAPPREQR